MFNALTHTFIYVLDQDEALDFYVGKGRDEDTARGIRSLVSKGGGSGVIFRTDDCRDPSGNPLRFTQPLEGT